MNQKNNFTLSKQIILGVQFLFVAFGATVLVPILVNINPSIALFSAGVGTLLFHFITKGKVPVFLGSSFAFIAPIIEATCQFGPGMKPPAYHEGRVVCLKKELQHTKRNFEKS